jgi:hypothetical protein
MARTAKQHAPSESEILKDLSERANALAGAFLVDLAKLFAGHEVELPYVAEAAAQDLRRRLQPFLDSGARLQPNFDLSVPMEVKVVPKDPDHPGLIRLNIHDMSEWQDANGHKVRSEPRRLEVELDVDGRITQILDIRMHAEAIS